MHKLPCLFTTQTCRLRGMECTAVNLTYLIRFKREKRPAWKEKAWMLKKTESEFVAYAWVSVSACRILLPLASHFVDCSVLGLFFCVSHKNLRDKKNWNIDKIYPSEAFMRSLPLDLVKLLVWHWRLFLAVGTSGTCCGWETTSSATFFVQNLGWFAVPRAYKNQAVENIKREKGAIVTESGDLLFWCVGLTARVSWARTAEKEFFEATKRTRDNNEKSQKTWDAHYVSWEQINEIGAVKKNVEQCSFI